MMYEMGWERTVKSSLSEGSSSDTETRKEVTFERVRWEETVERGWEVREEVRGRKGRTVKA